MTTQRSRLTAFVVGDPTGWVLEPAPARRSWMDDTKGFAYRCLPLAVANQAGWVARCPAGFGVVWNGGDALGDTTITMDEGDERFAPQIMSHFGWGILTFSLPWLFRTSPGNSLLVRGPTNSPKRGISPLDGIVETDWAVATFTMNWKITEPDRIIRFTRGEPICMISPIGVDGLEDVETRVEPIDADPDLKREFQAWSASRSEFNAKPDRKPEDWQKDYMQGKTPAGSAARDHRSRLSLGRFGDRADA